VPASAANRTFLENLFAIPHGDLLGLELEEGLIFPVMDGKGIDPQQLESIAGRCTTCRLVRQPPDRARVYWNQSVKMKLGGGSGGTSGAHIYTPPIAGVSVVSSAPVYTNGRYYWLPALFQGDPVSVDHNDYWLTDSSGNQTMTFLFENPATIALVRVCATTYKDTNRRSNYQITVTMCNGEVRNVTGGFVDTAKDTFGLYHVHCIRELGVIEIMFELTQEASCGVCLKKVEIWWVP
jgi:hypothetical protein